MTQEQKKQESGKSSETVLQRVFGEEALMEVNVDLSVVLGRTLLRVYQLLKLGRGAVVELNQMLNEPVEILANEIPIAKGEVIVTDEGYIGVKITDLMISQKGTGGSLISKSSVSSFGK